MNWSTPHILAAIALVVALLGGVAPWLPGAEPRVASLGFLLAVLLLCVAVLVS